MSRVIESIKEQAASYVYNGWLLNPSISFPQAVEEYLNDDGLVPDEDDMDETINMIVELIKDNKK